MVLNNGGWLELFEPFRFFEAYKNYLQIDIVAECDEDLMNWKGWVESRIRYLVLKVPAYERIYMIMVAFKLNF